MKNFIIGTLVVLGSALLGLLVRALEASGH